MLHRAYEKGVGVPREFRVRRVELGCLLDVLAGRTGLQFMMPCEVATPRSCSRACP